VDRTNKKYRSGEESSYIPNFYVELEGCGYLPNQMKLHYGKILDYAENHLTSALFCPDETNFCCLWSC